MTKLGELEIRADSMIETVSRAPTKERTTDMAAKERDEAMAMSKKEMR
jgi:hypothetical protein